MDGPSLFLSKEIQVQYRHGPHSHATTTLISKEQRIIQGIYTTMEGIGSLSVTANFREGVVDIFMDTLQGSYFEKIIGSVSSSFYDLVMVGERIESGLKSEKIQDASSSRTSEKESSTNVKKK